MTGFAWIRSWHGAQTMSVFRRILAMRAPTRAVPARSAELAEPGTWWTSTVVPCPHSSHAACGAV